MKKVLLGLIAIVGMTFMAINANAQTGFKIGIFDAEGMIQYLPEYRNVDSLLQIFQRDSIGSQYEFYQSEAQRLDSTFKADSAARKPKARLDMLSNQRREVYMNIINWQQIAQRASQQKYVQLAQPLYQKIVKALQTVCTAQHISIVIKPDAVEPSIAPNTTYVVDLSLPVAKSLGLKVNDDQQGGGAATPTSPARKSSGR